METITIPKKDLKETVKEGVREALDQELMKLRALVLPFASQKEQKNIERLYGKPSRDVAKTTEINV